MLILLLLRRIANTSLKKKTTVTSMTAVRVMKTVLQMKRVRQMVKRVVVLRVMRTTPPRQMTKMMQAVKKIMKMMQIIV
jgi:hypothetical protein